ncbi:NADH-quinone oxidoreductase subunit M [bacterium]|nr:NADH-quinone oxidoreductase subunit M [bacterium]
MLSFQSLIFLIFAPLIASLIILCPLFPSTDTAVRRFSKWFSVCHFLYAITFLLLFQSQNPVLVLEDELKLFSLHWIDTLGISATFSMDSLSLALVLLTTFIFFIAFVMSKRTIKKDFKIYYSLMFLLEMCILGIFCAKDLFIFFLLWELELVPMYFLISKWGSVNAKASAMKFLLYTFFGSIFILLGIFTIYFYSYSISGVLTSNMDMLITDSNLYPPQIIYFAFICFLIGFGVKLPIVPLHTWLADAHSDAPTPVSIVLAAILLKTGAYGLLRFNLSLFPDIFLTLAPALMFFAAVNCIYASSLAVVQKDIKRLIAFSSISQMGIFLIGLFSVNYIGLSGAVFQLISHAIIAAGLFTVAGILYSIYSTRDIDYIHNHLKNSPLFMFVSIPIILAAVGVPLFSGFIAEFLSFVGGMTSDFGITLPKILTSISIFTIVLSSAYILKLFHSCFFGVRDLNFTRDISGHRLNVLIIISVIVLFFGIFPNFLSDIYMPFIDTTVDMLGVQ